MKAANHWITYRTRFLVKAKQLTTSLAFTDDLGRVHSGRKGDYLVESSEGVLSIAPRQIFEDVYVTLQPRQDENSPLNENSRPGAPLLASFARAGRLHYEARHQESPQPHSTLTLPSHLTRKSPQPYRDRRTSIPGLRSV